MIADNQPGHIDHIKQTNAGAVYRLIDRFGPISRIDLSKKSQLAPASITKIIREMLEAHLVKETEYQEPGSRGRPAIGLVLDTKAWHFLAVRINHGSITLALRDLSSELVVEQQFVLPITAEEPLLQRIIQLIDHFFVLHQSKLERVTAIAISLPGSVNRQTGIVNSMPFYQVEAMPLGAELERRTGLPVYLQHDISAWMMAESLFGAARHNSDVIQVVIDRQVGAGVMTGGKLLHANSSAIVEIGHTQVDPHGQRCHCGHHGCLETVIGTEQLLQRAMHAMSTKPHVPLTIETLCDAALAGDPIACAIITETGNHIGRVLAMMVNFFHPQKVLIGSPLNRAAELLFPVIYNCIQQQALPTYAKTVTIEATMLRNQGTMPAAALVKEALYNGSLLLRLLQG